MTTTVEAINRLNLRFGSHKFIIKSIIQLLNKGKSLVEFQINNFSSFVITADCTILEYVDGCHYYTDRAKWLTKIAHGYVRDADGYLQPPTAPGASPAADFDCTHEPDNKPQAARNDTK